MKQIAITFAVFVAVVVATVTYVAWPPKENPVAFGSFIVVALTLVVLVVYAYDTNLIARVTHDRWLREGVLGTTYSIELIGEKGEAGRTLVCLHNPSSLVVRAKVACNFRVYGALVEPEALYSGKDTWLVFPQQTSQGWFELETLLQKKGKTVSSMLTETTAANRMDQFTMVLELEFWDELGSRRKLPSRPHYFDFDRWAWIPRLAETQVAL